jgi:hypothetical protein
MHKVLGKREAFNRLCRAQDDHAMLDEPVQDQRPSRLDDPLFAVRTRPNQLSREPTDGRQRDSLALHIVGGPAADAEQISANLWLFSLGAALSVEAVEL